jgi:hypothetical protein
MECVVLVFLLGSTGLSFIAFNGVKAQAEADVQGGFIIIIQIFWNSF